MILAVAAAAASHSIVLYVNTLTGSSLYTSLHDILQQCQKIVHGNRHFLLSFIVRAKSCLSESNIPKDMLVEQKTGIGKW